MKKYFYSFLFLFTLFFTTSAKAETLTLTFDGQDPLPEGWSLVGDVQNANDRARSGKGLFSYSKSSTDNYVITEELQGTVEFYARAYNKNADSYVVVYEYTKDGLGSQLYSTPNMRSSSIPTWSKYSFTLSTSKQIAIALNYAAIDDLTCTQAETISTPSLEISGLPSGSSFDFGGKPVPAGTTKHHPLRTTRSHPLRQATNCAFERQKRIPFVVLQ